MMEVKHSPSSQMEFRSSTNGLPNQEEDEEMDTLLDQSGAIKSIPTSSLECDSKPILNGNTKYHGLEDGMEIDLLDDDMDEELNTTVSDTENTKKHEDTEAKKGDIDLFDLDLEQAVVTEKKIRNGETTDSSSVRDTGDDLDTLLSKINDLVEDCMEPSTRVGSPTEENRDVVDLKDNESQDLIDKKEKEPEENSSDETEVVELEETIEEAEETAEADVETQNDVETCSEVEEEEKVELETEEELTPDEVNEVKSIPDLAEDVSEESGVEVTENDLEIAEADIPKVVEESIPEVGAEEITDVVVEVEVAAEEMPTEEMPAEEMPAEEISAEEMPAEEMPIKEKSGDEMTTEEMPAEEIITEEIAPEEMISEEILAEEIPVEETAAEKMPTEKMPAEEMPAEESTEEAITGIIGATEEEVVEKVALKLKKALKEVTTETMDIDDDIVCLDSPMPEEKEEETLPDSVESDKEASEPSSLDSVPVPQEVKEKQMETESKEIAAVNEVLEGASSTKEVIPDKTVAEIEKESSKAIEADDEIFLIEDDDEPMKEDESDEKLYEKTEESEKSPKETEKFPKDKKFPEEGKLLQKEKSPEKENVLEEEKLLEEETKEDSKPENEDEEKEKKTEVVSEEKPSETKEQDDDDDDDIVCLDDSLEETEKPNEEKKSEEKPNEVVPQIPVDKVVDDVGMPIEINKKGNEDNSEEQGKQEDEVIKQVAEKEAVKETEAANLKEIVKEAAKTLNEKVDEADTSAKKSDKLVESLEIVTESVEKSEKVVESLEQVIKPTEEVPKEASNIIAESETSVQKEIPPAASEPGTPSKVLIDNDIINLDDDDEDEAAPSQQKKDEKSSDEVSASKSLALLSDNSDNARDGVEEKDDKIEPKVFAEKPTPIPSETNSNSSSNLLKESTVTERDESRSEPSEQPPAKRIRLSQDEASSRNSNASQDDTSSKLLDDDEVMEILDNDGEENKTLKRVHSTESISSDFKKPKTDLDSPKIEDEKPSELLEEIIPAKVEPVKVEEKEEKKPVEVKPLPLYPPPNFDAPKIGLSLDFLRRFKKSIHKMNKSDLEELVLQKIVEAIVHKSEFSEMREMIEKQEKIISGHRSKITELNKQFRDLEMVHNRVLKDLETKNSQFIMPVKITRAVGLQVFFPNKKYDQPMTSLPAPSSVQAPQPSSLSRSVSTSSSSTSSIPEKAPVSSPTTLNNLAPQVSVPTAAVVANNQPRRGCIQKLTPMRPDGPRSAITNRGVTTGVVSSSTPSPMTPKDTSPKVLNRQITQKQRLSQSPLGVNASNSSLPQQTYNSHPLSTPPEPERPKAPLMPQGIATKKTGGVVKNFPPSKRIPKSWQSEQQASVQPPPTTAPPVSSPMVPPQSSIVNSSLPAKTPNKSVIDLTDEDDMAPTPTPSPKSSNASGTIQKAVNNAATHRVGPYKVSVIPAAQLQQQPRPIPPKQIQQRPPNLPQMTAKPNGTAQNSVRRTPPPLQQRYRHPAPLPNQPIHSSNPLWKLPPARPTIRISNLDSGIVISWTIEDMSKEKYAESTSYQIYAYQETSGPPLVESWRHVGDVKAMLLPMAVTLTQFQEGQRYYFAVRAVDAHNRCGPFSFAKTWS